MDKNKVVRYLLVFLTFLVIFGLNLNFKARNNDLFFHIKTGEYILNNKDIPNQDIFSYTASDNEWVPHEYMAAILFYFFENNFGINSLIFLKAAILTSMFYLIFKLIYKDNFYLGLIVTLFAAFSTHAYAYIRPHIFFWLFLVLIFAIFKYKRYWLLPLLTLIWANVHSSVIIGLIIIAIYLFDLFLVQRKLKYVYIGTSCFLAALINPSTYKIFLLPFNILKLAADINEWRPYGIESFWFWFFVFFNLIIILIFIKKKFKIKDIAVFLLFVILGFKSKRYVASSILVSIILIQPYLRTKLKESNAKNYFMIVVVLLLMILSISKFDAFSPDLPLEYLGKKSIDFVKTNNIEGNLYNSYELGGPIIYWLPEYKVFIDGRIDVYGKNIIDDYYDIRYGENLEEMIRKYDISLFVIDNKAKIGRILHENSNYSLIFFDDYYSVYVKNDVDLREFKIINPYYGLDPKQNTETVINEIEYLLSLNPNNVNALRNLGVLYFELGNKEKSLYYLNDYINKNPKDRDIKILIERIENG